VSGDILDAIDQAVAEHESCPCGREIPAGCPSWYWCTEACQLAWNLHQHDPAKHPHPRDIRERMEQALTDARTRAATRTPAPVREPALPTRRGALLNQRASEALTPVNGMVGWAPVDLPTAAVCAYQRWCPQCQEKRPPLTEADRAATGEPASYGLLEDRPLMQTCPDCGHRWSGRPLVGTVEQYDGPGFRNGLVRLRLTDGFRSATRMFPRRNLELWRAPETCLALEWEHLEEQLCDGVSDRRRQESNERARRTRGLPWDWRVSILAGMNTVRPNDAIRIIDPGGGS
jgi:hypothetical protein